MNALELFERDQPGGDFWLRAAYEVAGAKVHIQWHPKFYRHDFVKVLLDTDLNMPAGGMVCNLGKELPQCSEADLDRPVLAMLNLPDVVLACPSCKRITWNRKVLGLLFPEERTCPSCLRAAQDVRVQLALNVRQLRK